MRQFLLVPGSVENRFMGFTREWPAVVLVTIACHLSCSLAQRNQAMGGGSTPTDDYPTDITKWITTTIPKEASRKWRAAKFDERNVWQVFLADGNPTVRRIPSSPQPSSLPRGIATSVREVMSQECPRDAKAYYEKVEDGWLVGLIGGERGGGFWWFSPDGKQRYRISYAQPNLFLATREGVLALGGFMNSGYVRRVRRGPSGRWKDELVTDVLRNEPNAAILEKDHSLLVTTFNDLIRIHPSGKVEALMGKDFFAFEPCSLITTPSGVIYVGMRHYVARIAKKGNSYDLSYLLPTQAAVEAEPNE